MAPETSYSQAALAYVEGVRALFAPSTQEVAASRGLGPASYDELATRAEQLFPISDQLN